MVHAWTGIGKTMFSLASAVAIASGKSYLRFSAPKPRKVLYLDGEMPSVLMQRRFADAVALAGDFDPDFFQIYCAAMTDSECPDLGTIEGQARIDDQIHDAEVVFVDNISSFCRTGKENEAESWRPVHSWLMKHRREGRAIVVVHHDNKTGDQRGSSKKLDALDTVIQLRQPADYNKMQGSRFEVHFTKARHFWGDDAAPFEAMLTASGWIVSDIKETDPKVKVKALRDSGMSYRDIEKEVGMSKSQVARILNKGGSDAYA
jgi:putative DNA primase/helicase